MSFWGETIDPSKAELYQLPDVLSPLPPQGDDGEETTSTVTPDPTRTKVFSKPTDHLPPDHGSADGSADKPAFPQDDASESSPSISPTPDEGYFTHITDLLRSNNWLFGALALVLLFAGGIGFFFWRRAARRRSAGKYAAIPGDSLSMGILERGGASGRGGARSKELYDAFGEVSDDEADEGAALVGGKPEGFYSGFLQDDEGAAKPYRDHPEGSTEHHVVGEHTPRHQGGSDGDDSGSGSWIDAEKAQ